MMGVMIAAAVPPTSSLGEQTADPLSPETELYTSTSPSDVLEVVYSEKHRHVWAVTLRGHGQKVSIRMNEATWHDPDVTTPMYDIYLGNASTGYQTYLSVCLNQDGSVDGARTSDRLFLKPSRQQTNPWLLGALRDWIETLDGETFDRSYAPCGATNTIIDLPTDTAGSPIHRPGTAASAHGLNQFERPIAPQPKLDSAQIDWTERRLVFYGGLGAVVPRFYKEHLERLKASYPIKFVCVDLAGSAEGRDRISSQGLPYDEYIPASDFRFDPKNPPVGLVILTRPNTHFPLAEMADTRRVQVFVEKPIVHPNHLNELLELYSRRQSEMLAIDFFFDNPLVHKAMQVIDDGKIGRITNLRGSMIENCPVEPGREWLLNSTISGGGLGMDMMVHLTALAEMVLERWGGTIADATIDPETLVMARYEGSPEGTETYARLSGRIPGGITFSLDAGKGLHTSAYFLIVEGTEGALEINLGTENTPGFMRYQSTGGEEIYHQNQTTDIGYRGTVEKMLASSVSPAAVTQEERDFRVKATTLSVQLLHTAAYMFGHSYYSIALGQDPSSIKVQPDLALSVSERTRENFRLVDELAQEISESLSTLILSSSNENVSLDRYLSLNLGTTSIGHVDLASQARECSVYFGEDIEMSEGDRATIISTIGDVIRLKGWQLR